jgi:hypothetical protein
MFAKDTLEDPSMQVDRDGFLDEIERIAEKVGVFDADRFDDLDGFLQQTGPAEVPEPERVSVDGHSLPASDARRATGIVEGLASRLGAEEAYALLRFTRRQAAPALRAAALELLGPRLAVVPPDGSPYLEPELAALPTIATPKVAPKRLSTGDAPLEIEPLGSAWRMRCTGCGQASAKVQYRWQVFDQTVACRCA